MSGFISWCAQNDRKLANQLPIYQSFLRDHLGKIIRAHGRLPNILATLCVAQDTFLAFACYSGALGAAEASVLADRGWASLLAAAAAHANHQTEAKPALLYHDALRAALSSGMAHVVDKEGRQPREGGLLGWSKAEVRPIPRGPKIGWVDAPALFIDPVMAFKVICTVDPTDARLANIGEKRLRKELADAGLLTSRDFRRGKLLVRRRLEGVDKAVLHFDLNALVGAGGTASTDGHATSPEGSLLAALRGARPRWPGWPDWPLFQATVKEGV
jgi:hypothetical protein